MTDHATWVRCPDCGSIMFHKRPARNLHVCPDCGAYRPLTAGQRLEMLLDPDSTESLEFAVHSTDPLRFVDTKPYPERLRAARASTGLDEAVVCVGGSIQGHRVIVAAMDFRFMGGSLGGAVGEYITLAAETALRRRLPLLIVTASGGARMQEGAISLMQLAKTSGALGQLDEAGILTIALITDPTYGGVAASFATLCDVIVAEPRARLGFAGPRVIEQTIGERLPDGFQTAEYLLRHGMVDTLCPRHALRMVLGNILSAGRRDTAGMSGQRPRLPVEECLVRDPAQLPERDPWPVVRQARDLARPTTADYLSLIVDDFEQLSGDRIAGDCAAIIGGLARLDGIPIVVLGYQKGHTAQELVAHGYGMPRPSGYRKAARLMRLAAKLGLPVVTLIDTPGAYPGVEAEQQGQAVAIAENLRLMSQLPVPVVAVVTGEGGSGGALALGVANRVFICANAVYSVISPEGCAAILWKDTSAAPAAAAALRLDGRSLLEQGVVDGVVVEPEGGTQADHGLAAERLRAVLVHALQELLPMHGAQLAAQRRARFRQFGATPAAPTVERIMEGDSAR